MLLGPERLVVYQRTYWPFSVSLDENKSTEPVESDQEGWEETSAWRLIDFFSLT